MRQSDILSAFFSLSAQTGKSVFRCNLARLPLHRFIALTIWNNPRSTHKGKRQKAAALQKLTHVRSRLHIREAFWCAPARWRSGTGTETHATPNSRRRRQTGRGLGQDIAPASRSPNIGVAKPKLIIERFAIFGSLGPQQRSYHCGIAPNTHFARAVLLMFVNGALAPRFLQQISFRVGFSQTRYQNKVVCQNAIHRRDIVLLHRSLIFDIERLHRLLVICRGPRPGTWLHRYQYPNCKRHSPGNAVHRAPGVGSLLISSDINNHPPTFSSLGFRPSSASCRSIHVRISSRFSRPTRFFAAIKSALASSRQPRLARKAFQMAISSSLGLLPLAKHHSRISSSELPSSVRLASSS